MERIATKAEALKALNSMALESFAIPGDGGFALGSILPAPADRTEADAFRGYIKQMREEIGIRVAEKCYNADGSPNKWWMCFAKKKFMNKKL